MVALAWILGMLAGLCAIMGIITATEVVLLPVGASALADWMFWMILSGVLFLACIAATVGAGRAYE